MNAIFLTLFISLLLAALGIVLFVQGVTAKDHEHADRLSLLPLQDDDTETMNREGEPHVG